MNKPSHVTYAVVLLWITLGIDMLIPIAAYLGQMNSTEDPQVVGGIVSRLIGLLISAWIVSKISGGRNWARILYAILTVGGYALTLALAPIREAMFVAGLKGMANFLEIVGSAMALCFLFTREANDYFLGATA